jgi:hypothetical protein
MDIAKLRAQHTIVYSTEFNSKIDAFFKKSLQKIEGAARFF